MKLNVSCPSLTLLVLAVGLVACKSDSSQNQQPPPAAEHNQQQESQENSGEYTPTPVESDNTELIGDEHFHDTGSHLPRPAELTGWRYVETPMYYGAADLFELIDGGATSFIDRGMIRVAYAALSLVESPEGVNRPVGLEIYIFEFADDEGAAVKYADDHRSSTCQTLSRFSPLVHCETSSSIDFTHGSYYVRCNMDYPGLTDAIVDVVHVVLGRMGVVLGAD